MSTDAEAGTRMSKDVTAQNANKLRDLAHWFEVPTTPLPDSSDKTSGELRRIADELERNARREDGATRNLRNALEHIRLAASIHYLGQAFDPEHMRGVANLAARALEGEDVPPLPDPEDVRKNAAALAADWKGLFE